MVDVRIVRSKTELSGLSAEWNTLLERSGQENVFLTWEWVSSWVDTRLDGGRLLTITAARDGELAAIAPFWIENRRAGGVLPLRVLRMTGSPDADYVDMIAKADDAAENAELFWNQLFGPLRSEWDIFEYDDVPADSPVSRQFVARAKTDRRCVAVEVTGHSVCPYIELPDTWEKYLETFSRTGRYRVTYSERRLRDQGDLEFLVCDDIEDVDRHMSDFMALHQKSWQEKGKPGAFATRTAREFHHRVARAMFLKNSLFLASLRLDGEHIGSFYGFQRNKKVYYYLLGVKKNPVKRIKTGTALLACCIR
ncbi:MAG: GNAT family N-acetyltransferase, partial [bacterium]